MPSETDVALASCRSLPEPDPDAEPLARALESAGIRSRVLAWDDPDADWSAAPLTVLRSTWNYPLDLEAFLAWAARVDEVSTLRNPLPVVRWNAHKRYLLELERDGVPVAPTVLLPAGDGRTLREILDETGWVDAVVKPAVSAASFRTMLVTPNALDEGERHLADLLEDRDVLVQRYLPSVEGHGERAIVWIDGEVTHAVRKSPRFEGEDESVSARAVPISREEADLARAAVAVVPSDLLYARIDVAPGPEGTPVVMELELIEPSLFFPQCPEALDRFVDAIGGLLRGT